MKTFFRTQVSQMGCGSFVNINIFVLKYYFIRFIHILHFFPALLNQICTQMSRTQRGNSGVSFNNTLLNFGPGGRVRNNKQAWNAAKHGRGWLHFLSFPKCRVLFSFLGISQPASLNSLQEPVQWQLASASGLRLLCFG